VAQTKWIQGHTILPQSIPLDRIKGLLASNTYGGQKSSKTTKPTETGIGDYEPNPALDVDIIGDLSISDAKIDNLSATKLIAGIIQLTEFLFLESADNNIKLDSNGLLIYDSSDPTTYIKLDPTDPEYIGKFVGGALWADRLETSTSTLRETIVGGYVMTHSVVVASSTTSDEGKADANYVCDGTNDEVEIPAAIDECNALGGGVIVLLDGAFYTRDTIHLYDACYLHGLHKEVSGIIFEEWLKEAGAGIHTISMDGLSSGAISDLFIQISPYDTYADADGRLDALYMNSCQNTNFDRLDIAGEFGCLRMDGANHSAYFNEVRFTTASYMEPLLVDCSSDIYKGLKNVFRSCAFDACAYGSTYAIDVLTSMRLKGAQTFVFIDCDIDGTVFIQASTAETTSGVGFHSCRWDGDWDTANGFVNVASGQLGVYVIGSVLDNLGTASTTTDPFVGTMVTHFNIVDDDTDPDYLVLADVQTVTYDPTTLTVSTGTLDSGTVADLATMNTGDVAVSEVTGTPGFDIRIEYTGVVEFNHLLVHHWYDGLTGHTVTMQLWNYVTSAWDDFSTVAEVTTMTFVTVDVANGAFYVNAGVVQLRYVHSSPGNTSHDMLIDYAVLQFHPVGIGGGGVTDHGALTGLFDDDHPLLHNDARGDARYAQIANQNFWEDQLGLSNDYVATGWQFSPSIDVGPLDIGAVSAGDILTINYSLRALQARLAYVAIIIADGTVTSITDTNILQAYHGKFVDATGAGAIGARGSVSHQFAADDTNIKVYLAVYNTAALDLLATDSEGCYNWIQCVRIPGT
jgi:hypothetical protein